MIRYRVVGAVLLIGALLVALYYMDLVLLEIGFLQISLKDVVDVGLVTALAYNIHRIIRGTRGAQMMVGLMFIFLIFFLNSFLQMSGVSWLIENLKDIWIIAFVILFQPELRRLLISAGQNRFVRALVEKASTRCMRKSPRPRWNCHRNATADCW